MRTFKTSTKLAAASVLAVTAALAAPSAFADSHYRDADHGRVSYQRAASHSDRHDSHDDRRHHENRGNDRHDHDDRGRYRHDDGRRGHVEVHYRRDYRGHVYAHQTAFYRGRAVPVGYRHAIQPVPVAYRYRVPQAPRGYRVGYYQGYSVVYDPGTFLILSVIDLLANG